MGMGAFFSMLRAFMVRAFFSFALTWAAGKRPADPDRQVSGGDDDQNGYDNILDHGPTS